MDTLQLGLKQVDTNLSLIPSSMGILPLLSPEAVEADFILISHGHDDHVGDAVAIAKRTGAMVISVNEIAVWFGNQDIKSHGRISAADTNIHLVI
jgi:L-ascorbate metabolism protein UlaG (beta-lactamase superfamily)